MEFIDSTIFFLFVVVWSQPATHHHSSTNRTLIKMNWFTAMIFSAVCDTFEAICDCDQCGISNGIINSAILTVLSQTEKVFIRFDGNGQYSIWSIYTIAENILYNGIQRSRQTNTFLRFFVRKLTFCAMNIICIQCKMKFTHEFMQNICGGGGGHWRCRWIENERREHRPMVQMEVDWKSRRYFRRHQSVRICSLREVAYCEQNL